MKYVNSGALFSRKKTSDKAPDFGGDLLISADLIKSLPRDADGDIKIELAAWVRQSAKGEFFSLRASAPFQSKKEKEDAIPDPWA